MNREQRREAYDHIAAFAHHVLTSRSEYMYPKENLRASATHQRFLDEYGYLEPVRFNRWLDSLGFHGSFIEDTDDIVTFDYEEAF